MHCSFKYRVRERLLQGERCSRGSAVVRASGVAGELLELRGYRLSRGSSISVRATIARGATVAGGAA
jgi:hypothetical protein